MYIYFNPLDCACKNIIGAIRQGEKLQFNVFHLSSPHFFEQQRNGGYQTQTPTMGECVKPLREAFLRINKDGQKTERYPMQQTEFGWSLTLSIEEIGLYFYCFEIENEGYISCSYLEMGELGEDNSRFLLTVYSQEYTTPEWFKGGIMYQIFPDRFCKNGTMPDIEGRILRTDWGGEPSFRQNENGKVLNNDFFGGNLKGITEKLNYLQELGVTVLYLNPIFEAASNHRYDTSDYMKIDPILGTEQDFQNLIETAKNKGIHVILDGVFNHTGDNSVYFNKYGKYPSIGAYQSKDSPYYSWYTFHEFPEKYDSWWGIDILPALNENSEEYQNFIFGKDGVLKKWLNLGIGGYRLDVADELPDFFLKKLRQSVKETNENAIIIGEVWEDASNKIAYSQRREYLQGYELDSVMNYPLKEGIIQYIKSGNGLDLLHCIRVLINHYPKQTLDCLMNILGTHDTSRILTVLGGIECKNKEEMACDWAYLPEKDKEYAINKLKMAAVLQYTLPGIPCLYYGDENAMEGHIDPFCRRCFDWEHLNEDLINFYQALGKIRKKYQEIFKDGNFKQILTDDGLLYYKREKDGTSIYIYTNNSSKKYFLNVYAKYIDCITNKVFENILSVEPYSYKIFVKLSEEK